jgi:Putative DNA-binding domain
MPSLRELQIGFSAALFDGADAPIIDRIHDDGAIGPGSRFAIYRNNLHAGFATTLALEYPVVQRLVGDAYFRQTAVAYQRSCPSLSGDLHHVGRKFPEYLRQCFAATEFAYLPDVAELEWAIEEVAIALASPPLAASALAQLDPARYTDVVFELRSECRLLQSEYPIVRIWLANQPDAPHEELDLRAGSDHIAVLRTDEGIHFQRLRLADFSLARMLAQGMTLELAADAAMACDPVIDLGAALARLLAARVFRSVGLRP